MVTASMPSSDVSRALVEYFGIYSVFAIRVPSTSPHSWSKSSGWHLPAGCRAMQARAETGKIWVGDRAHRPAGCRAMQRSAAHASRCEASSVDEERTRRRGGRHSSATRACMRERCVCEGGREGEREKERERERERESARARAREREREEEN